MGVNNRLSVDCCICGGGPAGMMLGFLLARAGIEVVVLEKHKDFFRDFRGDTIHPSTFQLMHELNILDDFLKVPHQEIKELFAIYNSMQVGIADFTHLPVAKPVLGLMPQWDFLNFLAEKATHYPGFKLIREANVNELLWENGRVTGIRAETPTGILEVHSSLVVGADGRHSAVRSLAGLPVSDVSVPIDVLWFRIAKNKEDEGQTLGRIDGGKILIQLNRSDYWQCAYVIAKGDYEYIQQKGLPAFRKGIEEMGGLKIAQDKDLRSWDDIKLLDVVIDRLEKWYCGGLLCIGDAAHAMSPVGGVGINLAIQDAVAAANILYRPLSKKEVITNDLLKRVQQRRAFATMLIQKVQSNIHKVIVSVRTNVVIRKGLPWPLKLLKTFPFLRRIPARLVGIGIRPEHINTPEVKAS